MECIENILEKILNWDFQEYATIWCNVMYIIIVQLGDILNNALKIMLDSNGCNVPKSYFNISFYSKMYESIHFIKLYTITHMR